MAKLNIPLSLIYELAIDEAVRRWGNCRWEAGLDYTSPANKKLTRELEIEIAYWDRVGSELHERLEKLTA